MKEIKIGCLANAVSVAHTEIVMKAISARDSSIKMELITFTPQNSDINEKTATEKGEGSPHIKMLEKALTEGEIDLCVHNLKDMHTVKNPLLPLCAVGKRADVRDVLVLPDGKFTFFLNLPIGVDTENRKVHIKKIYPTSIVKPLSGDLISKLEKLDSGEYGAIVVSAESLQCLGLQNRISSYFSERQIIPACGQAIIAVQCRIGYPTECLLGFHDSEAWDMALSERMFLRTLGADYKGAAAAHTKIKDDEVTISGYVIGKSGEFVKAIFSGDRRGASKLGMQIAAYLKSEVSDR